MDPEYEAWLEEILPGVRKLQYREAMEGRETPHSIVMVSVPAEGAAKAGRSGAGNENTRPNHRSEGNRHA